MTLIKLKTKYKTIPFKVQFKYLKRNVYHKICILYNLLIFKEADLIMPFVELHGSTKECFGHVLFVLIVGIVCTAPWVILLGTMITPG